MWKWSRSLSKPSAGHIHTGLADCLAGLCECGQDGFLDEEGSWHLLLLLSSLWLIHSDGGGGGGGDLGGAYLSTDRESASIYVRLYFLCFRQKQILFSLRQNANNSSACVCRTSLRWPTEGAETALHRNCYCDWTHLRTRGLSGCPSVWLAVCWSLALFVFPSVSLSPHLSLPQSLSLPLSHVSVCTL